MGMVGPRMGQPNVNQLQNQYLSQGQFPGSGPGVGPAQPGMTQPGAQTGVAQVSRSFPIEFKCKCRAKAPVEQSFLERLCAIAGKSLQPKSLVFMGIILQKRIAATPEKKNRAQL